MLILGLALGFGGCAGKDQSTNTLGNLGKGTETTAMESAEVPLVEDTGFEDELFDPFDESSDDVPKWKNTTR